MDGCGCGCVAGCTDPARLGYNREAFFDDDSCGDIRVTGCTQPEASNYDPLANFDDGNCHLSACDTGTHGCAANASCVHIAPYHATTHTCVCDRGFSDPDPYDDIVTCELDYELFPVFLSASMHVEGGIASPSECVRAVKAVVEEAASARTNLIELQESVALSAEEPYRQSLLVRVVMEGNTFSQIGRHAIRDAVDASLGGPSGGVLSTVIDGEPDILPIDYRPQGRRQAQEADSGSGSCESLCRPLPSSQSDAYWRIACARALPIHGAAYVLFALLCDAPPAFPPPRMR